MQRLGMAITGLPIDYPSSHLMYADIAWDPEERPEPIMKSTPQHDQERAILLKAVDKEIRENQDIPLGTFCKHPLAIVTLNTGEAKPVCKKQYPLPMSLERKVMDQVHIWDEAGITNPAPTDCPWNNPLCVSPKKDALGNKTDDRVNFDARALNALLIQVDKHPMPTIQTAHDRIQGALRRWI